MCCGATVEKPIIFMDNRRRQRRLTTDSDVLVDQSSDHRNLSHFSHIEKHEKCAPKGKKSYEEPSIDMAMENKGDH